MMKKSFGSLALIGLVLLGFLDPVPGLQVTGVWSPSSDFLQVIARFGFTKSDIHHKDSTDGYIFGNVTSAFKSDESPKATLLLMDRNTFIKVNGNKKKLDKSRLTCANIFAVIDKLAFDENCNNVTARDMLRSVPCPRGKVCEGGSVASRKNKIVSLNQLTYVIEDQKQPTFWYLVLVACVRSDNCTWRNTSHENTVYKYNVMLVNGNPVKSSGDVFTYHFSYEEQDMVLYIVMIVLYIVLGMVQLYAVMKQRHRNLLVFLFTTSLVLHALHFFFATIHKIVFAHNGVGFRTLAIISDVIKIISLALFILFVLIIAKGWPITRSQITAKPLLVAAWLAYIVIELILFTWTKRSLDTVNEIDEFHTFPGWISLVFRIILMLWFLCELRATMMLEQNQLRLRFYLHFGAGIMVWFVHLPIVAVIGLQISLMWRYKLILGFSSAANFLAYAIVTHFMWPTKMSYRFLTHPIDSDFCQEELEYYDHDTGENLNCYNNPNYTNGRQANGRNGFQFQDKNQHVKS
ncbi:putative integral membrane protein [Halotydeus destructor]|nr:putative integral membrane protein [Halotydeus destructor]